MSQFFLPLSVLDRIVAVHTAAHDYASTSPLLMGVHLSPYVDPTDNQHGLTITATDGHILVEESYCIPAASSPILPEGITIAKDAVAILKDWLKSIRKSVPKTKTMDLDVQITVSAKSVNAMMPNAPVGPIDLRLVDGTYPNYRNALDLSRSADPDGNLLHPARYGINAEYVAALSTLWGTKASKGIVMDFRARGILASPLGWGKGVRRGLIMPICLPT